MENPNARLEAFSDGVFAIAITLLILEIKVPPVDTVHTKSELWGAFAKAWPSWGAFLLSFITILISWVNHSHALKLMGKSSPKFAYANGLFLLIIVVLPFPTAAVGEYIQTDLAQPAISLYCFVSLLNNVAWNILQYTMSHPVSLYIPNINLENMKKGIAATKMGFVLYSLIFALSFWFPITALILIAVSFVAWLSIGISIKTED